MHMSAKLRMQLPAGRPALRAVLARLQLASLLLSNVLPLPQAAEPVLACATWCAPCATLACVVHGFASSPPPRGRPFRPRSPWQRKRQYSSTSSGFVVVGDGSDGQTQRYLLTNAHSVEYFTQVRRRLPADATRARRG